MMSECALQFGAAWLFAFAVGGFSASCSSSDSASAFNNSHEAGAADAAQETTGAAGSAGGGNCATATCAQLGATCGTLPNRCGGSVYCGTCPPNENCGGGTGPNTCGTHLCTPATCQGLGASCGAVSDTCGGVIDCGNCPSPDVCGAKKPNTCDAPTCVAVKCADLGAECGSASDSCGGVLDCGTCVSPQSCGADNKCGAGPCVPKTCTDLGLQCGDAPDGCTGTLNCGTCTAPATCQQGICCAPKTCADLGASVCGLQSDGCGGQLSCDCLAPTSCVAGKCCPPEFAVNAFDAAPAGGCGVVCTPANALAQDGAFAGLDCAGSGAVTLDGQSVTACVGADFGNAFSLGSAVIRAKSTHSACGTACKTTYCDTGHSMDVFAGTTKGSYSFVKQIDINSTLVDYSVDLTAPVRYVVVCRGGSGNARDDVVVDSIHAGPCQ